MKLKNSKHFDSEQSKLIGNIISFPQDIEGVYNVLPSIQNLESIKIINIFNRIPNNIHFKKMFTVNVQKVIKALEWLKRFNPEYKEINIDYDFDLSLDEKNMPKIILSRIDYHDELENPQDEDAELLIHKFGLVNNSSSLLLSDKDKLLKLYEFVKNKENKKTILVLPTKSEPINEFENPSLLPGLYPTLFPLGTGGFYVNHRAANLTLSEQTIHF